MASFDITSDASGSAASGWTAYEMPPGEWHWTAYGRRGSEQGHAMSSVEAQNAAREAQERLAKPWA